MVKQQQAAIYAPLQSQIQLCERIITQVRFSSRMITVRGDAGGGKSAVAGLLLEQSTFANQALLTLKAATDDNEVRQTLLQQLLHEPLFNPADPLLDSFQRNLEQAESGILVVIDNAEHLSAKLLQELVALMQAFAKHQPHPLSVVLLHSEALSDVSALAGAHPLQMDVAALSFRESMLLATTLFRRASYQAKVENREAIEQHIDGAKGNPRQIYQFVDEIVNGELPMSDAPSNNRSKISFVLALILIAAVAGLLVQVLSESGSDNDEQEARIEVPLLEEHQTELPAEPADAVSATNPRRLPGSAESDDVELPELVSGNGVELGSSSDKDELRVIVEDEVVNRLLAEQSQPASEQPVVELESELSVDEPAEAESSDPIPAQLPETEQAEAAIEEAAEEDVAIKVTDVKAMLLELPESHYTLQLMALKNRQTAESFVSSRQWQEPVWVYRSETTPNAPYRIIYGNFDKRSDATSARSRLKEQGLDSLLKQFKQVQFEINN
ncbi:SPOR domain-containing protein [Aliagarivorans marinus]|uniref:SPOR domain-containing protein n=1 Tax=Aliagarivorans marinus TaxID=561965 RepID=UPI00040A4E8A|nr:AAA family ATPase [Aliagarivorans marinus]